MAKLSLNDITSRYGAVDALNANFASIEEAINNTVSRDGTLPNDMEAPLDMNSNPIINASTIYAGSLVIGGQTIEPGTAVAAATVQIFEFTASAGQTSFSLAPLTPTTSSVLMEVNGLAIPTSTLGTSGSTLTFPPLQLNDEVVVRVFTRDVGGAPTAVDVTFFRTGGVTTTVAAKITSSVDAVADFNVPNDGVTSATQSLQLMFNACAASGNVREIFIPPGTYLITNPNTSGELTAALVIVGLKRCVIRGAAGTKFIVNATGVGTPEFGFMRIEQCEDLEFCYFEVDGSGINNTTDTANRSRCFTSCSFDVNNTAVDLLTSNARLEFHHIHAHDIGGFVEHAPRNIALPPVKYLAGLSVHDCLIRNLTNVNHGVACPYSYGVEIYNNTFIQDFTQITPRDCMGVDASIGAENVSIRNNYFYGFVFGGKCESGTNYGPGANEMRTSRRVVFENNYFDQIGHPSYLIWPGPSGGDTYGIKLNGVDCRAVGNTIIARTISVTTGGLSLGILVQNKHQTTSQTAVYDNRVTGAKYGLLHDDMTPLTRGTTTVIRDNRFQNNGTFGALIQSNCVFENNEILSSGGEGLVIQVPDYVYVRRNRFFNCATVDNAVIPERVVVYQSTVGSVGYFEIENNVIIDTRGANAAEYAYFLRSGTTYTNSMVFVPGYTSGILTGITYDRYVSVIGKSTQLAGTTAPSPREIRSSGIPSSTAPWNTLSWRIGDRAVREVPTVGQPKAWVCTVAGTPGTWVSEGTL